MPTGRKLDAPVDSVALYRNPWTIVRVRSAAVEKDINTMATLTYTAAFRAFGAKLTNPMRAYSAITQDGAMVLSCWSHKFKLNGSTLTYADRLSRWEPNTPGKDLLTQHLTKAVAEALDVRLIVATTDEPDVIERGEAADKINKTFHVKPEVVGKVTLFDGDNFLIEFRKK